MFNLVAFTLVQDVMQQQFQTEPLHRDRSAPNLRWHLSIAAWTHPLATVLRHAADYLEPVEPQAAYASRG